MTGGSWPFRGTANSFRPPSRYASEMTPGALLFKQFVPKDELAVTAAETLVR